MEILAGVAKNLEMVKFHYILRNLCLFIRHSMSWIVRDTQSFDGKATCPKMGQKLVVDKNYLFLYTYDPTEKWLMKVKA